jgi:hypothetical protein
VAPLALAPLNTQNGGGKKSAVRTGGGSLGQRRGDVAFFFFANEVKVNFPCIKTLEANILVSFTVPQGRPGRACPSGSHGHAAFAGGAAGRGAAVDGAVAAAGARPSGLRVGATCKAFSVPLKRIIVARIPPF